MCERWVGDWTDCNILTPNSSVFSSTSFSFCWLLNRGPEGPDLCWELVLTASNCNSNFNCNWLHLTRTICGTWLYNCLTATCFLWRRNCTEFNPSTVKVIPWYLRPDAPVIYTCASLNWQLGRGSICNTYRYCKSIAYITIGKWGSVLLWSFEQMIKSRKSAGLDEILIIRILYKTQKPRFAHSLATPTSWTLSLKTC